MQTTCFFTHTHTCCHLLGSQVSLYSFKVLFGKSQALLRGNVAIPATKLFIQRVEKGGIVFWLELDEVVETRRLGVLDAGGFHGKGHQLVADGLYADAGNHVVADGGVGGSSGKVVEETCEHARSIAAGFLQKSLSIFFSHTPLGRLRFFFFLLRQMTHPCSETRMAPSVCPEYAPVPP